MQPTPTKRKRSRVACEPCRDRKRKCNGRSPCNTCSDWGYECHYGYQPIPQPPSLALTATELAAAPEKSGNTPEENERQHDENILRRLEANSGASFVRNIGVKVDAIDAPKMNLFGWNIGSRQLKSNPMATPTLSIFEITSPEEIKNLAKIYFDRVDPCYGLVNRPVFFQSLDKRSQSKLSNDRYDSVFAGVAALGSLFSRKDVTVTEVHLVQSARSKLEVDLQTRPSLDIVAGWILRVIYMRMTALPYPTWLASCTLMHLIEASSLQHEPSTTCFAQNTLNEHLITNNFVGIAQHLNLWISFDLGLPRVSSPSGKSLPPINGANDILSLLPASVSLDPEQATDDKNLESALLQLLDKHHTEPPSTLAQCNLVLCMLRRLNSMTHNFGPAIIDRILALLQQGLRSARILAKAYCPWHHIANVPFHTVTCLLVLDMRASFELLTEAMQTLRLVASIYDTDTIKNACRTAEILIFLYQRRRRDDIKLMDDVLRMHERGTEEMVQQPVWPDPDQLSWVESLVVGIPSLEGIEFEQLYPQGSNLSTEGSDFIPPIQPM